MTKKYVIFTSTLLVLLIITGACLAEERGEPLQPSFTYSVPDGYDAIAGVNEETGIEKLIITDEEQGTLITIIACYNEKFVGMDLAALYNDRIVDAFSIIYGGEDEQAIDSQIVVDSAGNALFIEMSDDDLTLIQYIEINPENGLLFFYGVRNTKDEGLTDEQLIAFDEVLASIAFSEG